MRVRSFALRSGCGPHLVFLTVRDSSECMGSGWSSSRGTHLAATRGRATACGRAVICVDARERWVSLNSLHSFFSAFTHRVSDRVVIAGDVSSHPPRSPPPFRVTSSVRPTVPRGSRDEAATPTPTRRRRSGSLKTAFALARVHPNASIRSSRDTYRSSRRGEHRHGFRRRYLDRRPSDGCAFPSGRKCTQIDVYG